MGDGMIKILSLLLCCSIAHAETTEELKARFEKEFEVCAKQWWYSERKMACQLKVANKLYLLLLIEYMKANGK